MAVVLPAGAPRRVLRQLVLAGGETGKVAPRKSLALRVSCEIVPPIRLEDRAAVDRETPPPPGPVPAAPRPAHRGPRPSVRACRTGSKSPRKSETKSARHGGAVRPACRGCRIVVCAVFKGESGGETRDLRLAPARSGQRRPDEADAFASADQAAPPRKRQKARAIGLFRECLVGGEAHRCCPPSTQSMTLCADLPFTSSRTNCAHRSARTCASRSSGASRRLHRAVLPEIIAQPGAAPAVFAPSSTPRPDARPGPAVAEGARPRPRSGRGGRVSCDVKRRPRRG